VEGGSVNAPCVMVLVTLEYAPRVVPCFDNDQAEARFREWAEANPHIKAIFAAVQAAQDRDDELRRAA
jgi:hypothetical protein